MTKSFHIVILVIFSLLIYSNTYDCSWHFDDHSNILQNTNLHLTDLSLKTFKDTIYSKKGTNNLYRPLSCFTFALNWYFGGSNVFGYHLVNILIHILASIFLYLVIIQLLSIPRSNKKKFNNKYEIALLASLFWAINPVNIQAVTYIVQRMASLAALFYIISIFFYLRFRKNKRLIFFFICFFIFYIEFF